MPPAQSVSAYSKRLLTGFDSRARHPKYESSLIFDTIWSDYKASGVRMSGLAYAVVSGLEIWMTA